METPTSNLYDLALRQGGVVSSAQARDHGWKRAAIEKALQSREWERPKRGFYRLFVMPEPMNRARAATVLLKTSVISHETAAEVHAFPEVKREVVAVTVVTSTTHVCPGVTVHRADDLLPHHRVLIDGIPVTSPERTAFDLCNVLGGKASGVLLDQLRLAGLIELAGIVKIHAEVGRSGKPGTSAVRSYLEGATDWAGTSPLESRALELFAAAGFPIPEREFPVPWAPFGRLDFAFVEQRLAVEVDGYLFHAGRDKFQKDRDRDRHARRHGWNLLRLSWANIVNEPDKVVGDMKFLLANPLPKPAEAG